MAKADIKKVEIKIAGASTSSVAPNLHGVWNYFEDTQKTAILQPLNGLGQPSNINFLLMNGAGKQTLFSFDWTPAGAGHYFFQGEEYACDGTFTDISGKDQAYVELSKEDEATGVTEIKVYSLRREVTLTRD